MNSLETSDEETMENGVQLSAAHSHFETFVTGYNSHLFCTYCMCCEHKTLVER